MGHYTELYCNIKLRRDTPKVVIDLLERVVCKGDLGTDKCLFDTSDVFKPEIDHKFFKCDRWYMLLLSNNFDETKGSSFFFSNPHRGNGYRVLSLNTEFKNYENEIECFIDWITPYVAGHKKKQYLGWWKSESMNNRINIYIHRNHSENSIHLNPF